MKFMKLSLLLLLALTISPAHLASAMQRPLPQVAGYQAAGIVPYAIDKGKAWILVGLEPARANDAFDFGGKKDSQDNNDPRYTAAREGAEELLFIYDETPESFERLLAIHQKHGKTFSPHAAKSRTYERILGKIIKDETTGLPAPSVLNNGYYMSYFVRFSYRDVNQLFQDRIKKYGGRIPHEWKEKGKLVWLAVDDVKAALNSAPNSKNVVVPSAQGPVKLWFRVADSLKDALRNNIFSQLK